MRALAQGKAWVISVNMGYGHDRAAYSLRHLAQGDILHANIYRGIPREDRDVWERSREFYEFISRFSKVPIIGKAAFDFYDKLQSIPPFYPRRDLTDPNVPLKHIFRTIKKGWGRHLIKKLSAKPLPLISTFFVPAFMAEEFDYPGEIYCVICDADFSRSWVPLNPAKSRIRYLAPTFRVAERLKLYGISSDRIFVTGFPLPKENLGGRALGVLRRDLGARLLNLDPKGRYFKDHKDTVREQVDGHTLPKRPTHPLTLTFAVGGAGAQRELGRTVVESLREAVRKKKIILNLIAGTRKDVADFFKEVAAGAGLKDSVGAGVKILYTESREDYFTRFNRLLRTTDILWTKPSELSFFAALGLPIIMAPPIGSQEKFNRTWLRSVGAGITQEDPRYAGEWLFDWLDSGWFAEAAMEGFLEAPRLGTYNIEKIVSHRAEEMREIENVLQY